ncbi:MAG: 1-(5-phosphoribosyl)-5-[(5-phosphoribosylamino)methylideneamino] imidazole-4-carboxamide isomerase [Polyangia bacterium]
MELIPAIDLRGGNVVRLLHGDFGQETKYLVPPAELYERYVSFGARRLHVVDLDGARDGERTNRDAITELATRGTLALQVGGGLRTDAAVEELLASGVARAVVGSLAATEPARVMRWIEQHGPERIVLALDVRLDSEGTPRITTHGWKEQSSLSLWDAVARYEPVGLRHVLCTDVGRDGALTGPNTALYAEAVRLFPHIEWQASGGVRDASDLAALAAIGMAAAVSGKALLEDRMTREELSPFLPAA